MKARENHTPRQIYRHKDELRALLLSCKSYFVTAMIFSCAINLLYLAGPLYMLQVYDRVVSSGSVVTLVMLTLVLLLAFAALSALDMVRGRILGRASIRLDQQMAPRVIAATVDASLKTGTAKSQYLRDFDNFRQCVTGAGIHAAFDLPWAPIYIAVIFVLHPVLGAFALASAIVLVLLAVLNERWVRAPLAEANEAGVRSYNFTDMSLRNSEAIQAMGMLDGLIHRWYRDRNLAIDRQVAASDRAAAMASLIRFLRLAVQSMILGLGAYLVIERAATVGAMFAASILLGRAMQPVEQIVAVWRTVVSALSAYRRVAVLLKAIPVLEPRLSLPKPAGDLSVENLSYGILGSSRPILRAVNFDVAAGELLGVVGPSGAGKSTLARHIVGVLAPSAGTVRLDGADVSTWPRASFGCYVGYLPQDVELLADSVAANISRFNNDDEKIIEAAKLAGVHEMILRLPDGYDTQVGEGGAVLSGGYRQRIALARAVYGSPRLVVLDEPASNLDVDGDSALADCLLQLKKAGTTVVIVSHRPSTLGVVDRILVMRDGAVELFGPRAEIMARLTRPVAVPAVAQRSATSLNATV